MVVYCSSQVTVEEMWDWDEIKDSLHVMKGQELYAT